MRDRIVGQAPRFVSRPPARMAGPLAPQRVLTVAPKALELAKLQRLREQAIRDATDPMIVQFASRLARPFAPDDWLAIVRTIFQWVRDGIRYQHDPNRQEDFSDAVTILRRGYDDCDGKVKVAVALMRALGIEADVNPVWRDGYLSHVQLRVKFPGSLRVPGNVDGWIYGEMTVRGAELAGNPYAIASNPETGKLPLSGGPPPRYLRGSPLD